MADLVIRGMAMPRNCLDCKIRGDRLVCPILDRYAMNNKTDRRSDCPIVHLPAGHGRLGDLDRLFEVLGQDANRWIVDEVSMIETDDVLDAIQNAPTIVPAEGGERS